MKVSVITATFNRESTIARAISSVKNQTFEDIESIVVDGASHDKTSSIVRPLLNEKDIFISEPDEGIYDALNKGIALASGDVIGFLHSDDLYFDNNVITKVIEMFTDRTIDIVYGDVCFFSGNNINKIKRVYRSDELTKKNLAWGKMPAHPAIFIRKRIYEDIGNFDVDFKIAADYGFLCRLINYPNIKSLYIPEQIVKMQIGGISTSGFKNTILLNKEVLRAIKKNDIYTNIFMLFSKYPSKILQFLRR